MRRVVLVAVTLAAAALATIDFATAAFVDAAPSNAPMSADRVSRWLGLEAPSPASCTADPDTSMTGADETAAIAAGGPEAGQPAGHTLQCSLVLRARTTLPEGATSFRVAVSPDPSVADQPLSSAAVTALDGSGPVDETTLAAGERRALSITVRDTAVAQGALLVFVHVADEDTGFLRYRVPVVVCERDLTTSCVTPPPDRPGPGGDGTTPGGTTPGGTAPGGSTPGQQQGQAESRSPGCDPRAPFTLQIPAPRGQRIVSATLRIDGRSVAVRRAKGRFSARVDLRRATTKTVRAAITVRTAKGRTVRSSQTLQVCAPKPVACTSRRSITIRLPRVRTERVVSATVKVNGRTVGVRRRGDRLVATVDLRKFPKQTVRVQIAQRTASGRVVRSTRRFRTCAAKTRKKAS
jgi:hypothetical protein